jgi:fatty-acyl-CoA synthase
MKLHGGATIGDLLAHSAARFPRKTALVFGERRLTYEELERWANRCAHALLGLRAGKGTKVALVARNSDAWLAAHFGVAKAGATLVPLNTQCVARELRYMVNDSDAEIVLFDPEFSDTITSMALPAVRHALALPELMQMHAPDDAPAVEVDEGDDYLIMYTSGTTGKPKGVVLPHRARVHQAIQGVLDYHMHHEQISVLAIPLFHTGGLNTCYMPHVLSGATIVLLPRADVAEVLKTAARERATFVFVVPTLAQAIADYSNAPDLSSLGWLMYGGAPLPVEVFRRLKARFPGLRFLQGYGSTEAAQLTVLGWEDHERKAGSAGRPSTLAEVRVVDSEMRDVAPGAVGEIVARGPFVMKEYYKLPEATAEIFRGGWLHTGDLARVDDEGFVTIVDREKDMIISGGENIYPKEIEEVLYTHPAVRDAAVFGVPDEKWGETVCATIVLKPGAQVREEEIVDYCTQHLARYKKPRLVRFVDALPRTGVGKIAKQELREPYWRGLERRI